MLLLVAIGILLVGAPLPYKSAGLASGGWAIIAYPKLYGALVLWAVAVLGLSQERGIGPTTLVRMWVMERLNELAARSSRKP
jgi:hypothetical protein